MKIVGDRDGMTVGVGGALAGHLGGDVADGLVAVCRDGGGEFVDCGEVIVVVEHGGESAGLADDSGSVLALQLLPAGRSRFG